MAPKKNFVLRLSAETYEALEKWAADDFRSVNGQLEWVIDQALEKAKRKVKSSPATPSQGKEMKGGTTE
ncbi:MAG: hypothetical protein ABIV51_12010 [Saprospiraceae bacterium]